MSFGRPISHTSKQATSIFFDGDDEPEFQQRPRRLQISSDDDRRSSADCWFTLNAEKVGVILIIATLIQKFRGKSIVRIIEIKYRITFYYIVV